MSIPSVSYVNQVEILIREKSDLNEELERIGVDIRQVYHLIARARYHDKRRKDVYVEKKRALDIWRKELVRGPKKQPDKYSREERLRRSVLKRWNLSIAKFDVEMVNPKKGKDRKYIHQLCIDLEYILSAKTKRPYRYMAALLSLFGLHPENFCGECRRYDTDKGRCVIVRIFNCPRHKQARNKIRKMTVELKKRFPAPTYAR